jgi:hypothetical protein
MNRQKILGKGRRRCARTFLNSRCLCWHLLRSLGAKGMACLLAALAAGKSVSAIEPDNRKSSANHSVARLETLRPQIRVVDEGDSKLKPDECRATLVGPGINQPDAFPGYGGFVGWESPIRLENGVWLVGFNAGYWHASAPTPLHYPAKTLEEYHKLGLPVDIVAPTGGRAMLFARRTRVEPGASRRR